MNISEKWNFLNFRDIINNSSKIFVNSDKIFISFRFDLKTYKKSWIVLTSRSYGKNGNLLSSEELLISTPQIPRIGGCWSHFTSMRMLEGQKMVSMMLDDAYYWLKYGIKYDLFQSISERTKNVEIIKVVKELDGIEKKFGSELFKKVFSSITVDNGSEFMDCDGMEKGKKGEKRTKIYYCHPYSSYERGSNENLNKMIRRWYPKGESFMMTSEEEIAALEEWMNEYPREIFEYDTAASRFEEEMMKLTG